FSPYCSLPATPPPALYPLSLHDALPILALHSLEGAPTWHLVGMEVNGHASDPRVSSPIIAVDNVMRTCATRGGDVYHLKGESSIDRKSTRLNSSHVKISYAVFCLKKKNT